MDKLNIVIISQTIYPMLAPRAFRTTELAKELAKQNHTVTIYTLTGNYDYSEFSNETGIIVKKIGKSIFGCVASDGSCNRNIITRGLSYLFSKFEYPNIELLPLTIKALKKEKKIDFLITIAVPYSIHWGAALSKRNFKVWASDCGDPFMGNPFNPKPHIFAPIEKYWCKKTDFIVVPVENAKAGYYREYWKKIRVIPQGFNFQAIQRRKYKENEIATFAYAGNVYEDLRDPSNFLKYLTTLNDINFKFIVYTKTSKIFELYKNKLGDKLIIKTFKEREILIPELSEMDFLINFTNESGVQQPSKLIDYYLSGRPILDISSLFNNQLDFNNFMIKNYSKSTIILNPEQYNIQNVVKNFIYLFQEKTT